MSPHRLRRWSRLILLALVLPLAAACEITPEHLHVGAEECAQCSMLISDRRFAAQLLSRTGKAWKFDSIECLHAFMGAGTVAAADVHSVWVTDLDRGEGWIPAGEASYLRSPGLSSPMGGGLAAFTHRASAEAAARELGGEVLDWNGLLALRVDHGGHHAHRPLHTGNGEHAAHEGNGSGQ
jgi:copper chaperone NosL